MPETDDYDPDVPTPVDVADESTADDSVCGFPVDRTAADWPDGNA